MNNTKLGTIIESEEYRDAIHIAIAPVSSEETVFPGQHVGLVSGSTNKVHPTEKHLGIVDPFLKHAVLPGQKFWVCLYPQTVTSLRHEWTHPAFDAQEKATVEDDPLTASMKWLKNIAADIGVEYQRMIEAVENNDYINMGENERYKNVLDGKLEEFKKHCEVVLGKKLEDTPYPFSCSC